MPPALWLLIGLRRNARWRRLLASLRTVRGVLLIAVSMMFFGCMIVPNLILPLVSSLSPAGAEINSKMVESMRPAVRAIGPLVLFSFAALSIATSLSEAAIYFSPAEIDFLFAAPFTRRQLLLYKLWQSIRNALWGGTLFALVSSRFSPHFLGSWLACVLAILFMNALTLAATLASQLVTEQAYTQSRRMILAAIALLIALGLWQALPAAASRNPIEVAEEFVRSPPGRVLLAPFEVFPKIATARSYGEVAAWSGLGLAMIAGLFALAISLDVNYLETAQHVSQRI